MTPCIYRVVVTGGTLAPAAMTRLAGSGARLVFMNGPIDEASLIETLAEEPTHAVLLRGNPPFTEKVIAAAKALKVIAKHGSGVDSVDLAAATAAGITVTTAGDTGTFAVAELTLAMMLALRRDLLALTRRMGQGEWDRGNFLGQELAGQVLGIIGLGKIGRRVKRLAEAFDMQVVSAAIGSASFDDLLGSADIVTLHCPLTPSTWGAIGRAEIARMKRGALLINTARGALVDETAVAEALSSGHLAGAAFDAFSREPPSPDHPLLAAPNVILTPHIATQTAATLERTALRAAENIIALLQGAAIDPAYIVNSVSITSEGPR